jgi:hypothetical protein
MTASRALGPCTSGRPERGLSNRPGIPRTANRRRQVRTTATLQPRPRAIAAFAALAQLPQRLRRRVLFRADSGGGTHGSVSWLAGRRLSYSVGMTITPEVEEAILTLPARIWEQAYDAGGQPRHGAWVAELTGLLDLTGWPQGMRVIVRKERPRPGAQLRFTDIDGHCGIRREPGARGTPPTRRDSRQTSLTSH